MMCHAPCGHVRRSLGRLTYQVGQVFNRGTQAMGSGCLVLMCFLKPLFLSCFEARLTSTHLVLGNDRRRWCLHDEPHAKWVVGGWMLGGGLLLWSQVRLACPFWPCFCDLKWGYHVPCGLALVTSSEVNMSLLALLLWSQVRLTCPLWPCSCDLKWG